MKKAIKRKEVYENRIVAKKKKTRIAQNNNKMAPKNTYDVLNMKEQFITSLYETSNLFFNIIQYSSHPHIIIFLPTLIHIYIIFISIDFSLLLLLDMFTWSIGEAIYNHGVVLLLLDLLMNYDSSLPSKKTSLLVPHLRLFLEIWPPSL